MCCFHWGFPRGSDGKASAYNEGDLGSNTGSGRSPGEENGNPLQYSCLENPMDCSPPGFPVLHCPLEFAQIHVHWVGDAIQPSHPLLPPSPPAFSLSQHQGLFQWVDSSHQEAKDWNFHSSISPSNDYSGLISFRIDWFDLCCPRDSQESSPAPQFESINSRALSLLYGQTLTSIHDYWKNHRFDYMDHCLQSDVFAF